MSFITTIGPKASRRYRGRWRTPDGRTMSQVFNRKVDAQRHLTGARARAS